MEAFFSSTGHLVVAVCNRKEYTATTVPVCQLCDEKWVGSILSCFLFVPYTRCPFEFIYGIF